MVPAAPSDWSIASHTPRSPAVHFGIELAAAIGAAVAGTTRVKIVISAATPSEPATRATLLAVRVNLNIMTSLAGRAIRAGRVPSNHETLPTHRRLGFATVETAETRPVKTARLREALHPDS